MKEDYRLSPSSYKDFIRPEACPRKWRAKWVTKELPREEPTLAQLKGNYFEYLCIGGGAREEDNVTELPLTATGKKTVDQERIEQQAEVFKSMLFDPESEHYLNVTIDSVQQRVENDKVKGYLDIKCTDNTTGERILIDLKLTGKIDNPRSDYDWSDPFKTDPYQLPFYKFALESEEKIDKLYFLVFDYSPEMKILFREVVLSESGEERIKQQIDQALEVITKYNENGWIEDPSKSECSDCPLQCESRYNPPRLVKDEFLIL